MDNKKMIILSLGGSIIIPREGFDIKFLNGFKKLISKFIKKGYKFGIVCGGGQTARLYQGTAGKLNKLDKDDFDEVGIYATWLNANLMKNVFKESAHTTIVKNPTKKINWENPILIAGGWKPGFSTDYDAVKLAKLYGVKKVINLSNIDYIYSKNPKKFSDAKKIKKIGWNSFCKIVGDKWKPGANLPFDPIASKEAKKNNLLLYFVKGTDLKEVEKAIMDKGFKGTIVSEA